MSIQMNSRICFERTVKALIFPVIFLMKNFDVIFDFTFPKENFVTVRTFEFRVVKMLVKMS